MHPPFRNDPITPEGQISATDITRVFAEIGRVRNMTATPPIHLNIDDTGYHFWFDESALVQNNNGDGDEIIYADATTTQPLPSYNVQIIEGDTYIIGLTGVYIGNMHFVTIVPQMVLLVRHALNILHNGLYIVINEGGGGQPFKLKRHPKMTWLDKWKLILAKQPRRADSTTPGLMVAIRRNPQADERDTYGCSTWKMHADQPYRPIRMGADIEIIRVDSDATSTGCMIQGFIQIWDGDCGWQDGEEVWLLDANQE